MYPFDFENQWTYLTVTVVVWLVIGVTLELVFFDGSLLGVIVQAVAGGLTSGFVLFHIGQSSSE